MSHLADQQDETCMYGRSIWYLQLNAAVDKANVLQSAVEVPFWAAAYCW